MQIGRAGFNACDGVLALQSEHRKSLLLAIYDLGPPHELGR